MEALLLGTFAILLSLSFLGCFIAKFPSGILALAAILLAKFAMSVGEFIKWWQVAVVIVLVVISTILNKQIPIWSKKYVTPYGKGGSWGTIVGSILALCMVPSLSSFDNAGVALTLIILLFLILPFVFATCFEFVKQKDFIAAAKSGGSAALVYVGTSFVKLITIVYILDVVFNSK